MKFSFIKWTQIQAFSVRTYSAAQDNNKSGLKSRRKEENGRHYEKLQVGSTQAQDLIGEHETANRNRGNLTDLGANLVFGFLTYMPTSHNMANKFVSPIFSKVFIKQEDSLEDTFFQSWSKKHIKKLYKSTLDAGMAQKQSWKLAPLWMMLVIWRHGKDSLGK